MALLTALADGTGGLLTFYWTRFFPLECSLSNCASPLPVLGIGMFVAYATGVMLAILGIAYTVPILSWRIRKIDRASFVKIVAAVLLLLTSVAVFVLHNDYVSFYFVCNLSAPAFLGINCANIFANTSFTEWTILAVVSAIGVVLSAFSDKRYSSNSIARPSQLLR